jgi:hypothetical protein
MADTPYTLMSDTPESVFPLEGNILDLNDKRSFIRFWSFDPPTVAAEPQYEHQPVHGRHAPYRFYSSTGPETWEFHIHLRGSVEGGDKRSNEDPWKEHLFLKSLAYPDYGSGKKGPIKPPHAVLVTWGLSINLQGVIKTPRFTWVPPYDENGYPWGIDVTFTLEVDQQTTPFDYRDVRAQAEQTGLGMTVTRSGR